MNPLPNGISFNTLDAFYDGVFTSLNLDYVRCFQVQFHPIHYFEDSKYANHYLNFIEALNFLDKDVVVSSVVRNSREYRGVLESHMQHMKEDTFIDSERKKVLKQDYKNARAIEYFLFFSDRKIPSSLFSFDSNIFINFNRWNPFYRPKIKYSKDEHENRKNKLDKNISLFFETFHCFNKKEMTLQDVCDYCYYHLNHQHTDIRFSTPSYYTLNKDVYLAQKSIREQVLHSKITLEDDIIQIGDQFVTVFSVDVLPRLADSKFFEKLSKYLTEDHEYMVVFERIDNQSLYDTFKKNRHNILITNSADTILQKEENDYALGSKQAILNDGELYMRDTEELNLKSFKFSILFTLKSEKKKEIQNKIKDIRKVLSQQEFNDTKVVLNSDFLINHYHAFLPGNSHQVSHFLYNNTLSLAYSIPIHEEFKGYDIFNDIHPTNQIYLNCKNEIVKYHTFYFDSNFKHHECTASTGSGKTFDLNRQIDGILSEKNDAVMKPVVMAIEPKRGFLKICRFYNGEVISYSRSITKSYNPFFKKKDMFVVEGVNYEGLSENKTYDAIILNYYINLLEHLCREENYHHFPPRVKGVLLKILTEIYDEHEEDFIPILDDIVQKLSLCAASLSDEDVRKEIQRVQSNLEYFCMEQYKNLFGLRESLNIQNDFLYFDLGSLEDDPQMKTTVLYILSSAIMRKLRMRNTIKYLFIDEASVFHQSEIGAKMIDYFLRLSRSLGGVIILGSQNVTDSIDSLASKTIKNALAVETCMWLASGHQYLTDLGYSEEEKNSILSLEKRPGHYVEIFRKITGHPMILRSMSNPYLYWLSTNDPQDDELFLRESESNDVSFQQLIEILAKKYPNGHYSKRS